MCCLLLRLSLKLMVGFGFRLRAFRIYWLGLFLGLWEPWGLLLQWSPCVSFSSMRALVFQGILHRILQLEKNGLNRNRGCAS
jgi:hypothetical protein